MLTLMGFFLKKRYTVQKLTAVRAMLIKVDFKRKTISPTNIIK